MKMMQPKLLLQLGIMKAAVPGFSHDAYSNKLGKMFWNPTFLTQFSDQIFFCIKTFLDQSFWSTIFFRIQNLLNPTISGP